jgi:hypothetical protein
VSGEAGDNPIVTPDGTVTWYDPRVFSTPEEAARAARSEMMHPANAPRMRKGGEFRTRIDAVDGGYSYKTPGTSTGIDYYRCSNAEQCQSSMRAFTGGRTVYVMHSHSADLEQGPSTCAGCDFDAIGDFNKEFGSANLIGLQVDANGRINTYEQIIVSRLRFRRGEIREKEVRIDVGGLFE